jgi:hypothetical protein
MKTQRVKINIKEIEKNYRIDEDGAVWSKIKNRYLKPTANTAGYLQVFLQFDGNSKGHWHRLHRLSYFKYVGECPDHLEVAHIDGNKWNCHWSNLEAVSHGRNVLSAYREHNRVHPPGNTQPKSWEAKRIMAERHHKPVVDSRGKRYKSIGHAAEEWGLNRKTIQRSLYGMGMIKSIGVAFEFAL